MPLSDKYAVLSSAVRISNSGKLPYEVRLQGIVDLIFRSFPLCSVAIYLVDEDRRYLTLKISDRVQALPTGCCIPFGEGVAGRCAQERVTVVLDGDDVHPDEWRSGDEACFVALPLLDDCRLFGVLSLGTLAHDWFALADRTLLDDLVAVLAGIVNSYILTLRSDRRTIMMEQISDLVKILNRSLHPDVLVPQILQASHRVTDSCCTMLRLFPNDDGIPDGVFHKVKFRFRDQLETFLQIEANCHGRVAATGFPLLATDLISDEEIPPSYISVPLLFESRPMGTLTFFGKVGELGPPGNYNEEERELFFNLATLMANALESGANYRKMVLLARKNQDKVRELLLLYRVGKSMLSTINFNELISLVLSALTAGPTPYFDRAMLYLIDDKGQTIEGTFGVTRETVGEGVLLHDEEEECLWCHPAGVQQILDRQSSSEFCVEVKKSKLPLDPLRNICSLAVVEKRVIHVPDITREKIIDRGFVEQYGGSEFVVAPLIAKDQVIGLLLVDNALSGRTVTEDEIRFLQLFSHQAGTAIENSLLYGRLEAANRQLGETQERLIQGERLAAIGEMAASIAHEVKGPLVSIGGFARRLIRKAVPESDEWRCADTIVREVARLENLLTDILSYSKKNTICYASCSMVETLEESLALVAHSFQENRIVVRKELAQDLPFFLGDCQQLKQVFFNLFINAQEAIKGDGEVEVRAFSTQLAGCPAVAVVVSDSGKGIPPEILRNIFVPFFTTKATGTGLGLPIVHRIITNHMGRIDVGNGPGGGAVFTVILPLHP
jgi:two-component system, NtrC family, sensor histidine kinase HydH